MIVESAEKRSKEVHYCKLCPKQYVNKKSLVNHEIVLHGKFPENCDNNLTAIVKGLKLLQNRQDDTDAKVKLVENRQDDTDAKVELVETNQVVQNEKHKGELELVKTIYSGANKLLIISNFNNQAAAEKTNGQLQPMKRQLKY